MKSVMMDVPTQSRGVLLSQDILRTLHCIVLVFSFFGTSLAAQTSAPAVLSIQKPAGRVLAGDIVRLSFYIGSQARPVADLFGLSFEVKYSAPRFVQPLTPDQVLVGSFLEPDTYSFARHEPSRNSVALAVSRKLGASGQSGFGEVLVYSFQIAPETPPSTEFCFNLENLAANDSLGNALPVVAGAPLCLQVADLPIAAAPNPFTPNEDGSNDQIEFQREGGMPVSWTITIMDRNGRVVRLLDSGETRWNGRDEQGREVLPGVYLYQIQNGEEVLARGVIGLLR